MRWAWASSLALALALLAGCGDGGGGSEGGSPSSTAAAPACGPDENLVSQQAWTHVVDPADAEYEHHPPTGGPHTEAVPEAGVHDEPVPEATQVTGLELDMVVLNYGEGLDGGAVADLEALAGRHPDLVVTPAPVTMDGGAVVALTAKDHRMLCDDIDLDAAEEFIERHSGGKAEVE